MASIINCRVTDVRIAIDLFANIILFMSQYMSLIMVIYINFDYDKEHQGSSKIRYHMLSTSQYNQIYL